MPGWGSDRWTARRQARGRPTDAATVARGPQSNQGRGGMQGGNPNRPNAQAGWRRQGNDPGRGVNAPSQVQDFAVQPAQSVLGGPAQGSVGGFGVPPQFGGAMGAFAQNPDMLKAGMDPMQGGKGGGKGGMPPQMPPQMSALGGLQGMQPGGNPFFSGRF
jgi:hypothetical protein